MAKQITVVWDELTRHEKTFTVDDDFPESWTASAAADDAIAERLEELVVNADDSIERTIALNVQQFRAA
ncbi:hypothetical protein [Rhodococcoides fascians]|uniref:hypothetical protein n=1 Tax=Rhodococcoides fascians TaxID=1828 RepID=UPI00050C23C9|nr:hypothetical protein [Rhodococcus fascians]